MQELFKMTQVSWDTIGQGTLKGIPDEFVWIEFWSISGKAVTGQPGMLTDEFFGCCSFMRGTAVPEQHNGTTQMLEQLVEKLSDFGRFDVLVRVKPGIQSDSFSVRGDTDSRDSRNLIPFVRATQDRGLSPRCPCSEYVRNEQEPTFVEKHQVSSEFFGFFLYSAMWCFSNTQSPVRPVLSPSFPVSDNSSQVLSGIAIGGSYDRICQNGSLLPPSPCVESKGRLYIRNSSPLSVMSVSMPVSAVGLIWVASRTPVSVSRLWNLSSDILSTNGILNSQNIPISGILPADSCSVSVTGWPAGVASPVALDFHGVSCIVVYHIMNIISITYA
jgi:hypothetical protein